MQAQAAAQTAAHTAFLNPPPDAAKDAASRRLAGIAILRQSVFEQSIAAHPHSGHWLIDSWQRCLASGRKPGQRVAFDLLSAAHQKRVQDQNQAWVHMAQPVMQQLAKTVASTRYFALMTDASGMVVSTAGHIDRHDRRAHLISRIGVDLSEAVVGTTSIGATLHEQSPVWLHRGEHFHADTSCYSCAGAPLFDPLGRLLGMLDLTGIDVAERPELMHLADSSARAMDDALVSALPRTALWALGWPGLHDAPGLMATDADGMVRGLNRHARDLLKAWLPSVGVAPPLSDLFGAAPDTVLAAARQPVGHVLQLPLWSGLRLQARLLRPGTHAHGMTTATTLKAAQHELIEQAMMHANGQVSEAAKALGISRATLYRRIKRR